MFVAETIFLVFLQSKPVHKFWKKNSNYRSKSGFLNYLYSMIFLINGIVIFFFKDKKDAAQSLCFSMESKYDFGIVKRVASTNEQTNEINKAKKR